MKMLGENDRPAAERPAVSARKGEKEAGKGGKEERQREKERGKRLDSLINSAGPSNILVPVSSPS